MTKRLYRSRSTRMIGGVCGGLADYFDIDPVLVRALFVITTFGYGIGFIAYIVFWIIVPEENIIVMEKNEEAAKEDDEELDLKISINYAQNQNKRKIFFGVILVLIGLFFFIKNFLPDINWSYIYPIILIAIGGYILYNAFKSKVFGS